MILLDYNRDMKIQYLMFKDESKDGIDDVTLSEVEKEIGEKRGDILYFIVQSNGGDPFSSVRIMNMLQNRFPKIYSIIPNQAMSAATLMVLGTDEIYMYDKSTLGPLDLPIEHPKDGSRISALDVQNTITTISDLSETIAKSRYKFLRENKKVSQFQAATLALQTATDFVKPIVEQIDPYHLQKSYRELKIGLYCALNLLSSRMMKDDFDKAVNAARALVNDYPSHEYSIGPDEAKKTLKLTIKDLEKLKEWNVLKMEFEKYSKKPFIVKYGEMNIATQQELKVEGEAQTK